MGKLNKYESPRRNHKRDRLRQQDRWRREFGTVKPEPNKYARLYNSIVGIAAMSAVCIVLFMLVLTFAVGPVEMVDFVTDRAFLYGVLLRFGAVASMFLFAAILVVGWKDDRPY